MERDAEEREVELEVQVQVGLEPVAEIEHQETPKMKTDHADLSETKVMEWQRQSDRKGKGRQAIRDWERETDVHSTSERDSSEGAKEKEKRRCGIKDVTNSPRKSVTEFSEEKSREKPGELSRETLLNNF